jgi:cobalt-zinc-cadmium efflux system membrane fusion protein
MKIIGFFAIGLVAVLSSCGSSNQENQEQTVEQVGNAVIHITKKQFEASELQLGGLSTQTFQEVVVTNGRLVASPESKANVSSYFAGSVKEIKLQIGQKVEKGQVLFVLEHPDFIQFQQDFLEASGRLLAVKADYERQKNLAAEQVSSQKNFQMAESEYKVLEVRIKAMAKKLTLMGINPNTLTQNDIKSTIAVKAPIAGYVTSLNLFLGAYLNPGETALTIIDTEDLQVELQIFEQDIHQIQIGQKVIFHVQNKPEQSFEGTISAINRAVDPQT